MLARWTALPLVKFAVPARDKDGLGANTAAMATWRELFVASVLAIAGTFLFLGPWLSACCLSVSLFLVGATGLFYGRRFGGITGDCLGATNQIVETAVLLTVSSVLQWIRVGMFV
jgi:adenosylcobinamide-GDP ribazoletransferase